MNMVKVDGLPISRLKENFVVIVLQSEREFEQLTIDSKEPIFVDDQKAYSVNGKKCYVFFHPGKEFVNKWVNTNAKH